VFFALLYWRVAHFREDIASRKVEAGTLGTTESSQSRLPQKGTKIQGQGGDLQRRYSATHIWVPAEKF